MTASLINEHILLFPDGFLIFYMSTFTWANSIIHRLINTLNTNVSCRLDNIFNQDIQKEICCLVDTWYDIKHWLRLDSPEQRSLAEWHWLWWDQGTRDEEVRVSTTGHRSALTSTSDFSLVDSGLALACTVFPLCRLVPRNPLDPQFKTWNPCG